MKAGTMEEMPKDKKSSLIVFIIAAIVCALTIAILLQGGALLFAVLLTLIIKYWLYILGGIGALLILKRVLFRRRTQDVRVVR